MSSSRAVQGTMKVRGRLGKAACAKAGANLRPALAPATEARSPRLVNAAMMFPPTPGFVARCFAQRLAPA